MAVMTDQMQFWEPETNHRPIGLREKTMRTLSLFPFHLQNHAQSGKLLGILFATHGWREKQPNKEYYMKMQGNMTDAERMDCLDTLRALSGSIDIMMTTAKKWLMWIVDGSTGAQEDNSITDLEGDLGNILTLLNKEPMIGQSFGLPVVADWWRAVYAATSAVRNKFINTDGKSIHGGLRQNKDEDIQKFIKDIEKIWTTGQLPTYTDAREKSVPYQLEIAKNLTFSKIF